MQEEIKTWLFDILNAIHEIDGFFSDTSKEFLCYKKDIRTKRAIERNITIIGEAMNRILQVDKNINITNARPIVNVRNRIMHGYDCVSDEIIWGIVIKYLPLLKQEIEVLMK
jgi:uncharacterized protein with HEPN domain